MMKRDMAGRDVMIRALAKRDLHAEGFPSLLRRGRRKAAGVVWKAAMYNHPGVSRHPSLQRRGAW